MSDTGALLTMKRPFGCTSMVMNPPATLRLIEETSKGVTVAEGACDAAPSHAALTQRRMLFRLLSSLFPVRVHVQS
ncbi:MAG TPA: hypothetical protein VL173_17260 [Vicinamibacterales bacterium]|nr:hypothetical protein [Vicinamibacterales bacterium]